MADDTYLFIDGEYLRQIHREAMRDFFGMDGELDIHEAKRQAGAIRAFFYDSIDETPCPGETEEACRTLGTPVLYNTAFQYRVIKKLWPELEVNTTFFPNGPNAGNKQVFLSPGLVVGKFHLWRRLGFAVGGGIQIAVTHFHTFNHNTVLTVRFPF